MVETDRGGDVTYHGPGQVVGYPILDLNQHRKDLHWLLRGYEEVMLRVLAGYGVQGRRLPGLTGVWVGGEKIGAIGVAVRRWVTYHGFAFNVDPDLSHFALIIPCGLRGHGVTSLRRVPGQAPPLEEVKERFGEAFARVFGFEVIRREVWSG
ncbi:MAG: lipoyl(octanoyl) transferase LipB [Moorellales bacterium]